MTSICVSVYFFHCSGLVPFAIGSETAGSMTYPAARCGITALQPTFGMVGRSGVMSISESLVDLLSFLLAVIFRNVFLNLKFENTFLQ